MIESSEYGALYFRVLALHLRLRGFGEKLGEERLGTVGEVGERGQKICIRNSSTQPQWRTVSSRLVTGKRS